MTPGTRAPSPHDAVSSALPRVCLGLAALTAVHAVLLLAFAHGDAGQYLADAEAGIGATCVLAGWLAGSRRLPAWRREPITAALLVLLAGAAGARAGVLGQPWHLVDLVVVAVIAAALLTRNTWFGAVVAGCAIAFVVAVVVSVIRTDPTSAMVEAWLSVAVALTAGGLAASGLRAGRTAWFAALSAAQRVAAEHAVRDGLTGAANRRGLEMVARPMIEHARRDGQAVHCLMIDIDGLRGVNEHLGHRGGDDVLLAVAEALRGSTRSTDVVARWGEDQFAILGPGTGTSPLEMERRVRALVKASPPVPEEVWSGRVSIGSATLVPWDEGGLGSLLDRAEADMILRRSLRRRAAAAGGGAGGDNVPRVARSTPPARGAEPPAN